MLNFKVLVGNEKKLRTEWCIENLQVRVQNTILATDFYLLALEGTEMVLGVAWLTTLGLVTMDFSNLTLEFRLHDTIHRWQRDTDMGPLLV